MNIDKKIEDVLMKNSHIPWDYYNDEPGVETDRCLDYKKALPVIRKLVIEVQKETAREMMINRHYVSDYEWEKYKDAYKQITGEEYEK